MLRRGLNLLHHTRSSPRVSQSMRVVPWEGSLATYARDLRAAVESADLPDAEGQRWRYMVSRLENRSSIDMAYELHVEKRADPRDYEAYVSSSEFLQGLKGRMDLLKSDGALWKDLTEEGAKLTKSELLAVLDRIHPRSGGIFCASTPSTVLWWHGQPGLLHGVAPAIDQVESALMKMHESGLFALPEKGTDGGEARLFRGLRAFQETFLRSEPRPGEREYAMCFQSCAADASKSFAATKPHECLDEMVIVNPRDVPAVSMNRLIKTAFPDRAWCETVLPIAGSGLEVKEVQRGILPSDPDRLFVKSFPLPPAPLAALHAELARGLGTSPPRPWDQFLQAGAARQRTGNGLAL